MDGRSCLEGVPASSAPGVVASCTLEISVSRAWPRKNSTDGRADLRRAWIGSSRGRWRMRPNGIRTAVLADTGHGTKRAVHVHGGWKVNGRHRVWDRVPLVAVTIDAPCASDRFAD